MKVSAGSSSTSFRIVMAIVLVVSVARNVRVPLTLR